MPQVKLKKEDSERQITQHYVKLKNLILSKQLSAAKKYFRESELIGDWRPLLRYTIGRNNCPVTRLIIDLVHEQAGLTVENFRIEISKVIHGRTLEFNQKVKDYMNKDKFDREFEKFQQVGKTVDYKLREKTGDGVVNLKDHHFR